MLSWLILVATDNEWEEFLVGCWAAGLTDQPSQPESLS